jgi:hypothetical protein
MSGKRLRGAVNRKNDELIIFPKQIGYALNRRRSSLWAVEKITNALELGRSSCNPSIEPQMTIKALQQRKAKVRALRSYRRTYHDPEYSELSSEKIQAPPRNHSNLADILDFSPRFKREFIWRCENEPLVAGLANLLCLFWRRFHKLKYGRRKVFNRGDYFKRKLPPTGS